MAADKVHGRIDIALGDVIAVFDQFICRKYKAGHFSGQPRNKQDEQNIHKSDNDRLRL